jgi:hypothetical protein
VVAAQSATSAQTDRHLSWRFRAFSAAQIRDRGGLAINLSWMVRRNMPEAVQSVMTSWSSVSALRACALSRR